MKWPFFNHAAPGIFDTLHDYESMWINLFDFSTKLADFQSCNNRKNNVSGMIAFTALTKSFFARINGKASPQLLLDHICYFVASC